MKTGLLINSCKDHNDAVSSVCYDSYNRYILSGSYDFTVKLWNSTSLKNLIEFNEHTDIVNFVCFGKLD